MSIRRPPGQYDQLRHSVATLLLSHHPPEHLHRTLALGWGRHRVRVCARCLGIAAGAVLTAAAVRLNWLPDAQGWLASLCILAASVPAVVDFHGQMMRRWESTNPRRVVTGAAFGAAVVLSVHMAALGLWLHAVGVPIMLTLYFAWVRIGRRRFVRMLQHLQLYTDYYGRCRTEDLRDCVRRTLRSHPKTSIWAASGSFSARQRRGNSTNRLDSTSFPLLAGSKKSHAFTGKAGFGMTSNKTG